ncbi:polyprotein [Plakobranchus ocellatus]|uniref:Polyprotein n=1 Tax=Plakobranchus ocellatus TaxID=259542 RepID=A0AAV3YWW6_9GAST|nr:polyprotein [Plakobranchus ocellatus]
MSVKSISKVGELWSEMKKSLYKDTKEYEKMVKQRNVIPDLLEWKKGANLKKERKKPGAMWQKKNESADNARKWSKNEFLIDTKLMHAKCQRYKKIKCSSPGCIKSKDGTMLM